MRALATVITVLVAAGPGNGLAAGPPEDAAAAPAHDPAHPPIDCPLHGKGMSANALRPFAETEKYIAFLERADRALWQKPDEVVAALKLTGRETVADVGAGSGYFTFRFARALPRGKVIATDIDPEMVRHVHRKVMDEKITNVEAVLADPEDPAIGTAADVVFVCDVIHHVEGREAWLRRAFSEMKAGARLVVVEFKEGDLPEGPPEAVKIPKAKLVAMLREVGFVPKVDDPDLLPYQTFLVFEKPGAGPALAPTAPGPREIDGRKVLTLVSNDPPGVRCNNNIQVAAGLANAYKVPILVYPVSFMPPGTQAPIVWFGGELVAQSGGQLNGMISFTELADRFEVEGIAKQEKAGLLMTPKVNSSFEALMQSIKAR